MIPCNSSLNLDRLVLDYSKNNVVDTLSLSTYNNAINPVKPPQLFN
jgi:hypothetical protein